MTRLALLAAILLVGCSAQPAGNATPRTADHDSLNGSRRPVIEESSIGLPSGAPHAITGSGVTTAGTSHGGAPLTPEVLAGGTTYSGIVNYAEPGLGRWYLAIPDGRGVAVTICGPGGCLDRVSTDAGPSLEMQRAGRIADLNSVDWLAISGVPLRYGGFQGTILIVKRPARIALPATDVVEEGE